MKEDDSTWIKDKKMRDEFLDEIFMVGEEIKEEISTQE